MFKMVIYFIPFFISLQSEVAEMKEKSRMAGGRYIQNQQLEEIRNSQDRLEKAQKQWAMDLKKQREEANVEEQRMKDEKVLLNFCLILTV